MYIYIYLANFSTMKFVVIKLELAAACRLFSHYDTM